MYIKKIRKCEFCGNEFRPRNGNQIFCSISCRKKQYNAAAFPQVPKEKKKNEELVKINEEARKLGMSYGQYQAMKTIEMLRGK